MKYKHKLAKLQARIKHWESIKGSEQTAYTKPGSQKK